MNDMNWMFCVEVTLAFELCARFVAKQMPKNKSITILIKFDNNNIILYPPMWWLCIKIRHRLIREWHLELTVCDDLQHHRLFALLLCFVQIPHSPTFKWSMVISIPSTFINSSFVFISIFAFIEPITDWNWNRKFINYKYRMEFTCVDNRHQNSFGDRANDHCYSSIQTKVIHFHSTLRSIMIRDVRRSLK